MSLKLTANSAARKLLVQEFANGEITGDEDPKDVWESDSIFQQHKLSNFRTHYNNLRRNRVAQSDGIYFLIFRQRGG